jgi:hypothetical protein
MYADSGAGFLDWDNLRTKPYGLRKDGVLQHVQAVDVGTYSTPIAGRAHIEIAAGSVRGFRRIERHARQRIGLDW